MRFGQPVRWGAFALLVYLAGCGGGSGGAATPPARTTPPPTTDPTPPPTSPPPTPGTGAASSITLNAHLLVDQFGYRNADPKVAVIRNPHTGYDSADTFAPGSTYQLRK